VKPALKKLLVIVGKIMLVMVLLLLVLKQIHWHDYQAVDTNGQVVMRSGLTSIVLDFNPVPFILAVFFSLVSVILKAQRWRLLLFIQRMRFDFAGILKLAFLGEFFNNILPGALGGDAVKAFFLIRREGRKGASLVSIFVDRFTGLCTLALLASIMLFIALLVGQESSVDLKMPAYSILVIFGAIILILVLSLHTGLYESSALNTFIDRLPFSRAINSARRALHRYRATGTLGLPIALYSFLGVVFWFIAVILIGMSLQVRLHWYDYFLYLPLIMIVAAVPVSPGGIGVLEELFLYFFGTMEEPSRILALVIFYRLCIILSSLPGALIFLFAGRESRRDLITGIQGMEETGIMEEERL